MDTDLSAKKIQSRTNHNFDEPTQDSEENSMLLTEELWWRSYCRICEETYIVNTPEEISEFIGTMTLSLSVVAPLTFLTKTFARRPQPLTFSLLASSNLEDEIHFKCGRFVTSQIMEC